MKLIARLIVALILLLSGTSAYAGDDCHCSSFSRLSKVTEEGHTGDCDNCGCSPFASCAECGGFVVSQSTQCDSPVLTAIDIAVLPAVFQPTEPEPNCMTDFRDVPIEKWEGLFCKTCRMRGSPNS